MWNPSEHSNDENVRWAWLRAVEWLGWPEFLTQPIVPVLLYFYPLSVVFWALAGVSFLWRLFIVPLWVSPGLAGAGIFIVRLKFIAAPVAAYLLWRRSAPALAVAALVWPLLGPFVIQWLMMIPFAPISLTRLGQATQIGMIQKRFLAAIGFEPIEQHDDVSPSQPDWEAKRDGGD